MGEKGVDSGPPPPSGGLEPSTPEPIPGVSGLWGGFGRNPPSGGGAPIFSLSPPVGAGGRHGSGGSDGDGDGDGHAPAAGASSRAGSFLNPFGKPPLSDVLFV